MKRRQVLLGLAALGAAGTAWWKKPRDAGAPYDDYFAGLNRLLRAEGPWRPCLVLDLDRLDHNLEVLNKSIQPPKHFRLVAKSLPSLRLMEYVLKRTGSTRLMAFHQPFLNAEAQAFPDSDILLGKPMPAGAAARFYDHHKGRFDPARQLQWLLDTPARLAQYLELATARALRLRINIEIDVGLHRGGVADPASLVKMLDLIKAHPDRLAFAGFMGYDPHVVKIPSVIAARDDLVAAVRARYQAMVDVVKREAPDLWREDLTLNGAGSPTYRLYEQDTLRNDLAIGSGLVKPTDFDMDTLADHVPALFIATPVLKVLDGTRIPGLEGLAGLTTRWDPNQRRAYFVYGGRWMARLEAPAGLRENALYGRSSNQEMVNGSLATGLTPDDHIFLRPTQSEALMLQFGDLVVVRGGKVADHWPVLTQGA